MRTCVVPSDPEAALVQEQVGARFAAARERVLAWEPRACPVSLLVDQRVLCRVNGEIYADEYRKAS